MLRAAAQPLQLLTNTTMAARTIAEIKDGMTTAFMADQTVQERYGFAPGTQFKSYFSTVSIENILFYTIAAAIYVVEQISYTHVAAVQAAIDSERGHTCAWYQRMVKDFLQGIGVTFNIDTNQWSTSNLTESEIEDAHSVKACAVNEGEFAIGNTNYYGVVIKVATADGDGNFTVLDQQQYNALKNHINRFKDAGVPVMLVNQLGDLLQFNLTLWIDYSKIYDTTTAATITDAIIAYLRQLPFNGELTMAGLTQAIMAVDGVELAQITQARVYTFSSGYSDSRYTNIVGKVTPSSGYFAILFDADDIDTTAGQTSAMLTNFTYYDTEGNLITIE